MISEVIAVFDIGKTNKKFLLFDRDHNIVLNEEVRFTEVYDEDGFLSEDISRIESWQRDCILKIIMKKMYIFPQCIPILQQANCIQIL